MAQIAPRMQFPSREVAMHTCIIKELQRQLHKAAVDHIKTSINQSCDEPPVCRSRRFFWKELA